MYSPQRKPILKSPLKYSSSPKSYVSNKKLNTPYRPGMKRLAAQQDNNNKNISLDEYVESKRKRAKITTPITTNQGKETIPTNKYVNIYKAPVNLISKRRQTFPKKSFHTSICTKSVHINNKINTTSNSATTITTHASITTPISTEISPSAVNNPKIIVCVRKRPLNKQELSTKEPDITELTSARTVEIHALK